ncbi:hypothetical protein [uncultured Tessaracoccus sp.]|uniref:hypothetical protein n=1 Tax=uncultured Tessaracoccus sp. TaxID=905023 RepID=UPI002639B6AB|nr:hypothetical protein [uncultured Tessaracoccus sp.]
MSYPPQQPWNQGGNNYPQQPQQWGGQPTGQPSAPQWGGQPTAPASGQQWGGQPGGQPSPQQWGGPQAPQGGPQQWGQQPQQWNSQQWGKPAPQKSKTGLWIGIGVGAVLLIAIIITLVLVLGGGKYAGKERPSLPSEFGGWSKTDDGEGLGISIGNVYEKDDKQVLVDEFDFKLDDDGEPDVIQDENFDEAKFEETKPAKGVVCYSGEHEGVKGTACAVMYEDKKGFSVVAFDAGSGSGAASKADVEQAATELSKQK